MTPTCATCTYWDTGRCHRRPPWALDGHAPCWPQTASTDWCGEHALTPPPTSTAKELHLTKELTTAGATLALLASELKRVGGPHRLQQIATTAHRRAHAEAAALHA